MAVTTSFVAYRNIRRVRTGSESGESNTQINIPWPGSARRYALNSRSTTTETSSGTTTRTTTTTHFVLHYSNPGSHLGDLASGGFTATVSGTAAGRSVHAAAIVVGSFNTDSFSVDMTVDWTDGARGYFTVTVSSRLGTTLATSPRFYVGAPISPISASFTGHAGEKTGDFSIGIDFAGSGAVTNLEKTDISIRRISGDTLADAGLTDFTLTGPSQGTNNYTLNFTPARNKEGVFEIDITGKVTESNQDRDVNITSVQISYDTSQVPIEWTPESTGGAATNPKRETTYTFELDFNGQLSTPQLLVPGAFVVTRSSNALAIIVSSVTATDAANGVYNVTVSIPELSKGWFELNLPAGTVARQIGQPGQQSTDSQRVYFDTTLPLWTVPSGTSTTTTPTVQVDFRAGTSGFTAASLEVGGTADDGVRIFSVEPNGNSTQVYDITLLVPVDATGNLNLTIQPASIMRTPAFTVADTSPNFLVDTSDIAEWTVPTAEVTTATATARINFGAAATGFAANEVLVQGTAASGVTITGISAVSGLDGVYDIALAIAEETDGDITLLIPALAVTRTPAQDKALVSPSFEVNRGIADIEATISGETGVKKNDFSLRVDFDTANAVTDFVAADVLVQGGHTLYLTMRHSADSFLCTLDLTTGVATRVGASHFTTGDTFPTGLAAIGNTLYMVSFTTKALYTVNTSTGRASRVGSATQFGVGESVPIGLAAIGNTLYMIGNATDALYIVNTTTGVATRVGSATNFGLSVGTPSGLAAIGSTLYMGTHTPGALYTLNTSTGRASRVGSATQFGVGESVPIGLAAIGNTLYMIGNATDALYIVNTTTGVATRVGSATNFGLSVGTPSALGSFRSSGVGPDIVEAGLDDYTITPVANDSNSFLINFTPNDEIVGTYDVDITGKATEGGKSRSVIADAVEISIDTTIADIEATITGFTGVKTSNFALRVDFNTVNAVTDFVAGDISLTRVGTTGADIMSSGLDDYTIAAVSGDNNSFLIQFTPASNISGTYMLDITGKVTENGKSRDVDVTAVTISVDTLFPALGAIFEGAAGIKSNDFKIGVQFDDGTDAITGVTKADFELTHISGATLAASGISGWSVAADPDNNRRYILSFPLNDNQLGTFQLDFADDAVVSVDSTNHRVASTPVTITFDSRLSDISATHQGPFEPNTTTPISTVTHEGFDIIVNFTTTGAITEFNAGNLSQRLNDPTMDPEYQTTIVSVDNDDNSFTVQFRLGVEAGIGGGISGSFVFDITGEVLDDGRRRNVTFTDATIRFNLPSYVRATITGSDNIAVAGAHSYMISFQSRFRITQFAQSDIEIQRISGSSLAAAGLGNFSRNRESDTAYSVILTFRAHVNGRAELKLVGTVNIQGIGSNITILSDPIDIFYNTVPALGVTPELLQLPTITLQRGTLHSFSLDEHIFGDVNTVEISSSASWITLTGVAGDGVNRSLRYAPPSSLTVSGRFDEYSVLVTAVGDGGTRRMRAYVNIFAPDENPINLIYWDLPENLDMGRVSTPTIVVSAIFSRALIAGETLLVSDIEIQGVTGVSVTAVTVDPLNNHKYDISLAIAQGATGVLEINIK